MILNPSEGDQRGKKYNVVFLYQNASVSGGQLLASTQFYMFASSAKMLLETKLRFGFGAPLQKLFLVSLLEYVLVNFGFMHCK